MAGPRNAAAQQAKATEKVFSFELGGRRYELDKDPGKWPLRTMRIIEQIFGAPVESLTMLNSIMASMVVSVSTSKEISLHEALDLVDQLPSSIFLDLADEMKAEAERVVREAKEAEADPTDAA